MSKKIMRFTVSLETSLAGKFMAQCERETRKKTPMIQLILKQYYAAGLDRPGEVGLAGHFPDEVPQIQRHVAGQSS